MIRIIKAEVCVIFVLSDFPVVSLRYRGLNKLDRCDDFTVDCLPIKYHEFL
jgi:hypothetical protein